MANENVENKVLEEKTEEVKPAEVEVKKEEGKNLLLFIVNFYPKSMNFITNKI